MSVTTLPEVVVTADRVPPPAPRPPPRLSHKRIAGMPDCAFHVAAHAAVWEAVKPVPPTGYAGLVDVATIMAGLATLANFTFNNAGVTDKFLMDPYLPGTAVAQIIQQVAEHAGINFDIDGTAPKKTLTIWQKGRSRGGVIPLISRDTGMIGYPTYTGVYRRSAVAADRRYQSDTDAAAVFSGGCGRCCWPEPR